MMVSVEIADTISFTKISPTMVVSFVTASEIFPVGAEVFPSIVTRRYWSFVATVVSTEERSTITFVGIL